MNGNAFGFTRPPQRPSIPPQAVGQMLMQRSMGQQGSPGMASMGGPPPQGAPMPPSPQPIGGFAGGFAPPPITGAQQDLLPIGGDPTQPANLNIMQREALLRAPAATLGTQRGPANPMSLAQLQRFGLSPAEIELLRLSGSVK